MVTHLKHEWFQIRELLIFFPPFFYGDVPIFKGSVQTAQNDVWYHFKEGYSNAVRRSVKMADFL